MAPTFGIEHRQHPDILLIHDRQCIEETGSEWDRDDVVDHHIVDLGGDISDETWRSNPEGFEDEIGAVVAITATCSHHVLHAG